MNALRAVQPDKNGILLETPNFYMRRLTVADASERVGSWFGQDEVADGLNVEKRPKSKSELERWFASFDQDQNRIYGMCDKRNGLLVTIGNSQFNWDIGRVMMNVVVGEPAYRHCGAVLEGLVPVRDIYFEEMGMKVMTATALSTNKTVMALLESTGSIRNQTLKNHKVNVSTGKPVDLHLYSVTREQWREWKERNRETVAAIRDCSARLPPAE